MDMDAYWTAYKLKRAQVFTISMKNLDYQVEKKTKPETISKTVVPEKYQDFLDVLSMKNLDTLFPY